MKKGFQTLFNSFISLTIFPFVFNSGNLNSQENINSRSTLKSNKIFDFDRQNILIPFPVGNFDSSSKKVNFDRNPFLNPINFEINNVEDLYTSLDFKGIAQTQSQAIAIISINNKQKTYKVGDKLDNGFLIQSISLEKGTVDIGNGRNSFRLGFVGIN